LIHPTLHKKAWLLLILLLPFLYGMGQNAHQRIKIATFNIQNLGQTKLAKDNVMDTLVAIIRHFDIVAVQEISDKSNETAGAFLNIINQNGNEPYAMACSHRTGRETDDRSSQEQYAFYYNPAKVQLIDTALYDDSQHDYFQREPFVAQFKTKLSRYKFVICTVHTAPKNALAEIAALKEVAGWIPSRFKQARNMIFCGDFNASCNYASPDELAELDFHKAPFVWIIPDDVKTNLSKNTCAYDRFVITCTLVPHQKKWEVYRYFKSKSNSDHWPVYIEMEF
jgi:endonuclease/exonuclease/phosphatase family metal-dependent hydrolase